ASHSPYASRWATWNARSQGIPVAVGEARMPCAPAVSSNGEITNRLRASRSAGISHVPMFRLLAKHYGADVVAVQDRDVQTYRELFAVREFSVLFATRCLAMLSGAAAGLALGTITYTSTGSPILTAL